MHESSMRLMEDFRDRYLGGLKGCSILDVGAAMSNKQTITYRTLFEPDYQYTGMDIIPARNVDLVGYRKIVHGYDVVISGQVLEHIERPWEFLTRLARYFREYICIIAPNQWHEHRYPVDCFRYYPDGMRALFDHAGIIGIEFRRVGKDTIGIGTRA